MSQDGHVVEGDGVLDQFVGQLLLLVILKGQGSGTVQTQAREVLVCLSFLVEVALHHGTVKTFIAPHRNVIQE